MGVEVAVDLAVDPSVEAAEVELLGAQHTDTQRPAEAGLEPQEVVELEKKKKKCFLKMFTDFRLLDILIP